MENLGKVFAVGLLLVCGVLLQLLLTHIILSISILYGITFITQLKFAQVFGTLIIISLIRYRNSKTEEKDFGEMFLEGSKGILSNLLLYLTIWGLSFITYYIVF